MSEPRVAGLKGFLSSGGDARRGRSQRRTKSPEWVGDGLQIENGQLHVAPGDEYVRVTDRGVSLAVSKLSQAIGAGLAFISSVALKPVRKLLGTTGGTASTSMEAVGVAVTDPADTPASADALRDDLVANTIPSIEAELTAIRNNQETLLEKYNELLEALR